MHNNFPYLNQLGVKNKIAVFSSGGVGLDIAMYTQQRKQLEKCPTCKIKEYQDIFGLTNQEIAQLEEHMRLYSIIRQCCGL